MRVECVFHDSEGSTWVGTHARGVARIFRGEVSTFGRRDGIPGRGVFAILESGNVLWLATDNGLCYRDRDGFSVERTMEGVSFLWGACSDSEGALWFAMGGSPTEPPRVCRIVAGQPEVVIVDPNSESLGQEIASVCLDQSGRVWLGGDQLYVYDGVEFTHVGKGLECGSEVRFVSGTSDNSVLVVTAFGTYRCANDEFVQMQELGRRVECVGQRSDGTNWATTRDGDLLEISGSDVRMMGRSGVPFWRTGAVDHRGRIWLGTYGFGLYCFSDDRIRIADSESGLAVDSVQSVAVHRSEVWVATQRGVTAVGDSILRDEPGSSGVKKIDETTALATDNQGRLWLGKRNGAVYVVESGDMCQCAKAEPLRRHRVDCIVPDEDGGVWISAKFGAGLVRYRTPDELEVFTPEEGNSVPSRISSIALSPDGRVHIGSADPRDPGIVVYDGGEFQALQGISSMTVSAMCFDLQGRLWVGGEEGLSVYDQDFEIAYGVEDGLTSELVTTLMCDSAGKVWVGTEGGGVCIFDGIVFQATTLDRPLCNTVNDICEGEDGVVWIATNGGLIWRRLVRAEVDVSVEKVIADEEYEEPEFVQFPDTVGRLTVLLRGGTEAARQDELVYQYNLGGEGDTWSQSKQPEINIPGLSAGDYLFRFRAIDGDLNYSPERTVKFSVVDDPRIVALNRALRAESLQGDLVGESGPMQDVLKQVTEVSWTDLTVLVLGETGTGKGLVARQIHDLSERREQPFIHVNCGSMQESLVDSELFGHERGAFTGAVARRLGKFELAQGGTIFLDEIGDLPVESQARLLRVLQERTMERIGGAATIQVNVRVIAATNRDLSAAVRSGSFRDDLFYRLNVFPIRVPPLRERTEDAKLLVEHFSRTFSAHLNRSTPTISSDAINAILGYDWPGNVRELEHTVHRAVVLSDGEITVDDLGIGFSDREESLPAANEILPLDEFERRYLRQVLEYTGGVIHGDRGAARLLQIKPTTLRSRLERLGIKPAGLRKRLQ